MRETMLTDSTPVNRICSTSTLEGHLLAAHEKGGLLQRLEAESQRIAVVSRFPVRPSAECRDHCG